MRRLPREEPIAFTVRTAKTVTSRHSIIWWLLCLCDYIFFANPNATIDAIGAKAGEKGGGGAKWKNCTARRRFSPGHFTKFYNSINLHRFERFVFTPLSRSRPRVPDTCVGRGCNCSHGCVLAVRRGRRARLERASKRRCSCSGKEYRKKKHEKQMSVFCFPPVLPAHKTISMLRRVCCTVALVRTKSRDDQQV